MVAFNVLYTVTLTEYTSNPLKTQHNKQKQHNKQTFELFFRLIKFGLLRAPAALRPKGNRKERNYSQP